MSASRSTMPRMVFACFRYNPAKVGSWILEELVHFFDLVMWYAAENGMPASVHTFSHGGDSGLSDAGPDQGRRVRLHRALLQCPTQALDDRIHVSAGVGVTSHEIAVSPNTIRRNS